MIHWRKKLSNFSFKVRFGVEEILVVKGEVQRVLAEKKRKTLLPAGKALLVEKERWETLKDDCEGNPHQ